VRPPVPLRRIALRAAPLALFGALAVPGMLLSCRGPAGQADPGATIGSAAKGQVVCYECHIDFKGEGLTTTHQRAGVTCVRCHGQSKPHMEDEVRKTPPDALFRGPATKVFCLTCHLADYAREKLHAPEEARAKAGGKPRSCTECHGEHRIVRAEPEAPASGKSPSQ